MPKVLGLDYGTKRTGIALTDSRAMIASPLETVDTKNIFTHIQKLLEKNDIDTIVVGEAKRLNGQESEITVLQQKFVTELTKKFPGKTIARVNEMFTSSMASQSLFSAGYKKSDRAKKENIDMVSAAIILQSFLDSRK